MNSAAENIVGLYRRHATAWLRQRGRHLIERKWLDRFIAQLPAKPKVLDIGCGPGEPVARYLLETGVCRHGDRCCSGNDRYCKGHFSRRNLVVSDI
jgi:SAM-dependent methyltransferase